MKAPRLRAAASFALVFALGAVTGVAGMRFVAARRMNALLDAPPAEARRRAILWALDHKLHLSAEQHRRAEAILDSHRGDFAAVSRSMEPQLAPLLHTLEGELRATLTPEQLPEFDRLAAELERRRQRALGAEEPR